MTCSDGDNRALSDCVNPVVGITLPVCVNGGAGSGVRGSGCVVIFCSTGSSTRGKLEVCSGSFVILSKSSNLNLLHFSLTLSNASIGKKSEEKKTLSGLPFLFFQIYLLRHLHHKIEEHIFRIK